MPQPTHHQSLSNEGAVILAVLALQKNQIPTARGAAKEYAVHYSTVNRRAKGIPPRRDCAPNSRKLTPTEESAIVERILDLDSRGFPPRLEAVRDMANKLLADRAGGQVGKNWPTNFIKRIPELRTRLNRKYDDQRARCEDPELIAQWFALVRNTIAKYGIVDDDIFNFDEAGFLMGVIAAAMVVTASERRARPKTRQPGNREWVTVIQGVNAGGWAIPPFVIFKGQHHLSAWYSDDIPGDWVIATSDNGWTTNELTFQWLQHFEKHTKDRTTGAYRLLILDGHESHHSAEFESFCQEDKIITLCMPAHSSHLLQPLDVSCFAALKKAYGKRIEDLMRNHINHITKLEFLPGFKAAFEAAFIPQNITGGFRGAGLVPHNPDAVISKLDVRLRTPTPPQTEAAAWDSQTPRNPAELVFQTELIRGRIARHQDSSPTPINEALSQLAKGAQMMAHSAVLLQAEVAGLQKANEAATGRKKRKKKRIQQRGTITIQEGQDLVHKAGGNGQISQEMRQGDAQLDGPAIKRRRCGQCGEVGHNSRTCQKDAETTME